VVEQVRQAPALHGRTQARWRLVDLQATCPPLAGYRLPSISRLLRRLKVSRQRGRLSLHSPDLAYQTKLAAIARVARQARDRPEEVVVCYGDEFSLYRQPTLAPAYAPVNEPPQAPLSHRRNDRQRYSGALNLVTGQVTYSSAKVMGRAGLQAFVRQLRAAYPHQRVILIWDNWPVHRHAVVLAAAIEARIDLLWLPTYAPWTNPIEKLWRWLKQTLLHHHRLADHWDQLKQQVSAFLDRFAHGSSELLRYVGLLPD
jgi:transposase